MRHDFNFGDILTSSQRGAWQIDDVLPAGAELDFSRPFLPAMLARTRSVPFLGEEEARILNVELAKSPKVCAWEIAEVNPTLDHENRMAENGFEILEATVKSLIERPVLAEEN